MVPPELMVWAGQCVCVCWLAIEATFSPWHYVPNPLLRWTDFTPSYRIFRNMDDDGSKALNEQEFTKGIKELGLQVNNEDIRKMFKR